MNTLMAQIRALGHLPRQTPGLGDEHSLAIRLRNAKNKNLLSASQLAELAELPAFSDRVTGACATETLMTEIQAFGRCPKRQQVDLKENAAQCVTAC